MATAKITTRMPQRRPAATKHAGVVRGSSLALDTLRLLASLRLTVVLFAAAILLVLFATLAQVHYDVWHVVRYSHFRVWVAWVEFRAIGRLAEMLLPDAVLRGASLSDFPQRWGTPFPGGIPIGGLMLLNLLAAHALRFRVTARGAKLATGLAVVAGGCGAVAAVIVTSNQDTVKSELSPAFADGLWNGVRALAAILAASAAHWSVRSFGRVRTPEWVVSTIGSGLLAAGAAWVVLDSDARLDDAALRILWPLLKGTAAAAILLLGCQMLFGKRGGMVLLHGGVVLLMVGEAVTGVLAQEAQMQIAEGETKNYAVDIRTSELALTDRTDPTRERVTVVPQAILAAAASRDGRVCDEELPFDLRVVRFDANSAITAAGEGSGNLANRGAGLDLAAQPLAGVNGVNGGAIDYPSAYVELLDKANGDSLGVYLVSTYQSRRFGGLKPQPVAAGDRRYSIELRRKRLYKPYAVKLHDFQFKRYPGTQVAKDYRAKIQLIDPDRNVDRRVDIWMNNPLRYGGDTLYQLSFDAATERVTTLQVVTNSSWLIPYLSCQIVLVGMLAHFGGALATFMRRRVEEAHRHDKRARPTTASPTTASPTRPGRWSSPLILGPTLVGALWSGYLGSKARPERVAPDQIKIAEFAALPVTQGGRLKPLDTFARNTLQSLCNRQAIKVSEREQPELFATLDTEPSSGGVRAALTRMAGGEPSRTKTVSAARWMLDVIAPSLLADEYRVFQIDSRELLDLLDLPPRPGARLYSYAEVMDKQRPGDRTNRDVLGEQIDLLDRVENPESFTLFQKQVADLVRKLRRYHAMTAAFAPLSLSEDSGRVMQDLVTATQRAILIDREPSVRPVAPETPGGPWLTLYEAELLDLFRRFPPVRDEIERRFPVAGPLASRQLSGVLDRFDRAGDPPTTRPLVAALRAYRAGDVAAFNIQLRRLREILAEHEAQAKLPEFAAESKSLQTVELLSLGRSRFEAWFNGFSPFYYCMVSYLVAFLLFAASWVAAPRTLGRSAVAVIAVAFLLHTLALGARVYMSGRAPVTDLHSSALFVSWGVVLIGLVCEAIFRMGLGSAVASAFAVITLRIASLLGLDGDSMAVMQAVLDTNFWLWTHVLCISMGYVATFFAGGAGAYYLLRCHLLGRGDEKERRRIEGITYGIVCFAIFFSFVGTVLGGLWGDNSWGRFWGWDPKENGALIVVLWNALVLHARWGKMSTRAGFAAMAVAGNMLTTWSWFGTNELGEGLHAYGGLSEGVSLELSILRWVFWTHPILLIAAALPNDFMRPAARRVEAPADAPRGA